MPEMTAISQQVYRLERLQNLDLTADQRIALAYIARELETTRTERLSAGKLKKGVTIVHNHRLHGQEQHFNLKPGFFERPGLFFLHQNPLKLARRSRRLSGARPPGLILIRGDRASFLHKNVGQSVHGFGIANERYY
jgi:hypothetical protein